MGGRRVENLCPGRTGVCAGSTTPGAVCRCAIFFLLVLLLVVLLLLLLLVLLLLVRLLMLPRATRGCRSGCYKFREKEEG